MQQQTDKTNFSKNKRLKNYLFFEPKKINPFSVKMYKRITIDNNFIHAFNEFKDIKKLNISANSFKIIMFENTIFYVTLAPEMYRNKTIIN